MPEPILCEYLLKLATDSNALERFEKLDPGERFTFLKTLGLHDGPARALADGDEEKVTAAVENELLPRSGEAERRVRHTIQMSVEVVMIPATPGK